MTYRGLNAAAESMFSTIKGELEFLHGIKTWPDHASLRSALFDYIEIFYNRTRHQTRLGHRTPHEIDAAVA